VMPKSTSSRMLRLLALALGPFAWSLPARAETPVAAAPTAPSNGPPLSVTAPPMITALLPKKFDRDEIEVRVGMALLLALKVAQPSGTPVTVAAFGLPRGATYDDVRRSLSWTPGEDQVGEYPVRFQVSDGTLETSRILLIRVGHNAAPSYAARDALFVVGERGEASLAGSDPDSDVLRYSAKGLPAGATLDALSGSLSWIPRVDQVGNHSFTVTISDGTASTSSTQTLRVLPASTASEAEAWNSYLLPGVGYSVYTPRGADGVGSFHGLNLEVLVAAWIHRNDNRGPSLGRVYVNIELMRQTENSGPLLFTYSLGTTLSFERNPRRSFLIPFYGVEVGGIVHRDLGSRFQATPYLGAHLYADRNVFVGARLGYRVVPSQIDELGGIHAAVNANVSVW
jgi:Putative Ig domain